MSNPIAFLLGAGASQPFGVPTMNGFYPGFPIWSWYCTPQSRRHALIFLGSDAGNPQRKVTPGG
jgi:hypothetical protein